MPFLKGLPIITAISLPKSGRFPWTPRATPGQYTWLKNHLEAKKAAMTILSTKSKMDQKARAKLTTLI